MKTTADKLSDLYTDVQTCAELVGLSYKADEMPGLTRLKRGTGFSYTDEESGQPVAAAMRKQIEALVIPPAWQAVWICPEENGHILATGIDEKGRKQYIYHPKWRTMRDLVKFYRMIIFGHGLPKIRKFIETELSATKLTRSKVMACMLWILDNAYIRIGNDAYFRENESVGLTTLTDKNIVIAGSVVTLAFKGKSGKDQQITFEDERIAAILAELAAVRGARLFRYKDEAGTLHELTSSDINAYLQKITDLKISAKDFRTWGGTLMAFMYMADADKDASKNKVEKVALEAVDQAAAVLGNTRTVARASYVHPHLLNVYAEKHFGEFYKRADKHRRTSGLDVDESTLLYFLEEMFESEFKLLKQ